MQEPLASLKPGLLVYAADTEIGEVVEELHRGDVVYVHVRRFGPGEDDLYIPSIAIRQLIGGHAYLNLTPDELLGQAWHVRPGD